MDSKEIRIGALYPLTSSYEYIGQSIKQVIDFYVHLVNTQCDYNYPPELGLPCLHGKKIKLIWADTMGDSVVGTNEALRLVKEEGVVAIIGSFQSSVTAAVSLQMEILNVPYLSPNTDASSLTQRGLKWFFRTGPTSFVYTKAYFDLLTTLGFSHSSVGSLAENSYLGLDEVQAVVNLSQIYGHDIKLLELYNPDLPIPIDKLLRIKYCNPDFLFTEASVDAIIQTIRTFQDINYYPMAIFHQTSTYTYPQILNTLGMAADYAFSTVIWSLGLTKEIPLARIVNHMYKDEYGIDINTVNGGSYVGIYTLVDAICRSESLTPYAIRKALTEINICGKNLIVPWKGVRFDCNGQNIYAKGMIDQIQHGTPQIVWPLPYAEAEAVIPAPQWTGR